MSIGIGLIGAGVMGGDHALNIARNVAGAHLAAVSDADRSRAEAVAKASGAARGVDDPYGVIDDPKVDAVLIASPDHTHAGFVMACLSAGKPVLCEKPLSPTIDECLAVMAAESALGRRLVQVGFMRRFDPAYVEMKAVLLSGALGEALMLHCVHRNAAAPSWFDATMSITNSLVHEIDIIRWLLSSELTQLHILKARQSRLSRFEDPLFAVFETAQGHIADVEVFIGAGYGYEVRGELVCERGTVSLASPVMSELRSAATLSHAYPQDWRLRFAAAYRLQLQEWVESIRTGHPVGASAFDAYVATAAAQAGVASLRSGTVVPIKLEEKPALYA